MRHTNNVHRIGLIDRNINLAVDYLSNYYPNGFIDSYSSFTKPVIKNVTREINFDLYGIAFVKYEK